MREPRLKRFFGNGEAYARISHTYRSRASVLSVFRLDMSADIFVPTHPLDNRGLSVQTRLTRGCLRIVQDLAGLTWTLQTTSFLPTDT